MLKDLNSSSSTRFSSTTPLSTTTLTSTTRALLFIKNILRDSSITSTRVIGKEVYTIKFRDYNKYIGYLGFLVNKSKLDSLASYILNLGLKYKLSRFFIIISYPLENKFYYLKVDYYNTIGC